LPRIINDFMWLCNGSENKSIADMARALKSGESSARR